MRRPLECRPGRAVRECRCGPILSRSRECKQARNRRRAATVHQAFARQTRGNPMPRGERSLQLEDLTPTRRIEENNAASGGHRDDPIPERPNSRMAAGDVKRAAAKAVGAMGLSKKHDPDLKMSREATKADGTKRSAGARS